MRRMGPKVALLLCSLIAIGWAATACLSPETALPETPAERERRLRASLEALEPVPEGGLRVALVFTTDVDLDLRVTDPRGEVVHYAHPRAASGLHFGEDRQCGDPAPRIEQAEASPSRPGRYLIGIDYRLRCDGRQADKQLRLATRWYLRLDRGGEIEWSTGRIEPGQSLPQAAVIEVVEESAGSGAAGERTSADATSRRSRRPRSRPPQRGPQRRRTG